ncbi:MAG: redox-regulated ATPase YchF [Planctomycetota bacterium]
MGFTCGIVGLPRVGKSTIFRAITAGGAAEHTPPSSPLEPDRLVVDVPDPRLDALVALYHPKSTVHAKLEVVDIAGVQKGASRGEGLGNQFLGHIKDTEALLHVVRCFDNPNVPHVHETLDPVRDVEEVELELAFKDAETVGNKITRLAKKAKGDKDAAAELAACETVKAGLEAGAPARAQELSDAERAAVRECNLLTLKPVLFVANVAEGEGEDAAPVQALRAMAEATGAGLVALAGRAEADIAELDPEDRQEFMDALGVAELSLDRLIHEGYRTLGLATMFTAGEDECRAWTIRAGSKAPQAAGKIHTDMEKGFIRMEVTPVETLLELGGETQAKAAGKTRLEGKDYIVQDGDVAVVRFAK